MDLTLQSPILTLQEANNWTISKTVYAFLVTKMCKRMAPV